MFYVELRLESVTPTALFPTHHTLTQGSLHYRLATLAIKSATPTALKHSFFDTISFVLQYYLMACHAKKNIIYNMGSNDLSNDMHRGIIQYPIPHVTICTKRRCNLRHFQT